MVQGANARLATSSSNIEFSPRLPCSGGGYWRFFLSMGRRKISMSWASAQDARPKAQDLGGEKSLLVRIKFLSNFLRSYRRFSRAGAHPCHERLRFGTNARMEGHWILKTRFPYRPPTPSPFPSGTVFVQTVGDALLASVFQVQEKKRFR